MPKNAIAADSKPKRPKRAPMAVKRQTFTLRLANATRDRARQSAEAAGRSMSEELELRIEKSFDQEDYLDSTFRRMLGGPFSQKMVLGISNLLNMIEVREKKSILDDVPTAMLAFVAMHELINKIFDDPKIPEHIQEMMRRDVGKIVDRSEGLMASPDMLHVLRNMALADMWAGIARGEDISFDNYEDLKLALDAEIVNKSQS